MNGGPQSASPGWHIVESGERWFQAVVRFSAGGSAESPPLIRRWDPAAATGLIALAAQMRPQSIIVLWELPHEPQGVLATLEAIAAIQRAGSGVMQLVHLPPRCSNATALLAQEVGVSLLVEDLWSLQKIVDRLTRTTAKNA